MKNRYPIVVISALSALFAASCNDYLDETPDNRTELDSDDKITRLLTSAYPKTTYALYTNYMSDDHDDIGTGYGDMSNYETFMTQAWNWEHITEESDDDAPKSTWESHYTAIAVANQALDAIAGLGNPSSLDAQRGEALICRAYAHFRLVNLFCQHYSEEFGATDLGIPYSESPETEVSPVYSRGTVKDVYEKIDRDIEEGLPLIDDNIYSVPKYHFNRLAATAFAAEFNLYYRRYDKAIEYANVVLGNNPEVMMRDLSSWRNTTLLPADVDVRGMAYINATENANLLLMTCNSSLGLTTSNYYYGKRYLYNVYISNNEVLNSKSVLWTTETVDINTFLLPCFGFASTPVMYTRLNIPYIFEMTDPVAETGFSHSVLPVYTTENSLLVRAEANVMKANPDYAAAMADINLWVRKHVVAAYQAPKTEQQVADYYGGLAYYTSTAPTTRKKLNPEVPFADAKQEAFIHALLHLRRIEFFGEGQRWFDVKRYGIEITRRQFRYVNGQPSVTEEDKLAPRDPRRAIQLPVGVIAAGMEANPR